MGFSASFTVKRSAFGMAALVGPVGDDARIAVEAEVVREP